MRADASSENDFLDNLGDVVRRVQRFSGQSRRRYYDVVRMPKPQIDAGSDNGVTVSNVSDHSAMVVCSFRLRVDHLQQARAKAKKAGVPLSTLARILLLHACDIELEEPQKLRELVEMLDKVGPKTKLLANINQRPTGA